MNNLIEYAKKIKLDLEVKKTTTYHEELRVLNDEIKQNDTANLDYYNIKTIIKNKWVSISTEDISDIQQIIKELEDNANIIDNQDEDFLAQNTILGNRQGIDYLNINKIKEDLLELNNYKKQFPHIFNIDSILENSYKSIDIINTKDIALYDESSLKSIYISVTVKKDDLVSEVSDYYLFKEYSKQEMNDFFLKVVNDAINRLEEQSINTKRYQVIINNSSMYAILKTFQNMFSAQNINKSLSLLSDSFNKLVFSHLVNIVEMPESSEYFGHKLFDSEGNRCLNKTIIKDGVFVSKLYDNKSALKDNTKSTGNADGVNNMFLVPGKSSFNDLVKNMDNGVIITDLSGLHSGVNTSTGDMSLDAKGYLVENGQITKALKSILLSANIKEVLGNVKMIGNDLKFYSTNIGSPSILVENIMIVGED